MTGPRSRTGRSSPGPAHASAESERSLATRRLPSVVCLLTVVSIVAAGCSDDSSPLNVVPATPTGAEALQGESQVGTVGASLPDTIAVRVTDRYGNPVPGVSVDFSDVSGDGSLEPASPETDSTGVARAEWTLGTTPGGDTAEAVVSGIDTVRFDAVARAGAPSSITPRSGQGQRDTVGSELDDRIEVRVADPYGNPVADVEVAWVPSDTTAEVASDRTTTDSAGHTSNRWTLGTRSGTKFLRVQTTDSAAGPHQVDATALPDTAAEVSVGSGDQQSGPAGSELPEPLVAEVTDRYGNPIPGVEVEWTVLQGGGTADSTASTSDGSGLARTPYTLGDTAGEERIRASAAGVDSVTFTARASQPINLAVDQLYVTQATQRYDGSVPLLAGRRGLLRVFVRADSANDFTPDVEIRLYRDGSLVETRTLGASEDSVRTDTTRGRLSASWNTALSSSTVQPGLGVVAEVDPENEIVESDESDNVFPRDGTPASLDVRELPTFRVRLVPVHIDSIDTTGNVDEQNKDDYLEVARALMPLSGYDADVRSVYTSDAGGISTSEQWSEILQEIRALRTSDGSSRYYYGVVAGQDPAWCGLGYYGLPAAIGLDRCGASTAAHEWGHNWDRQHVACGDPANPDPNYPYQDGSIGVWGYDLSSAALRSPAQYRDLMSYCDPAWISDYTYEGVLSYRQQEASATARRRQAPEERSLVLWGRVERDSLVLEPAYEAVTRPSLPSEDGPYRIRGLDSAGRELFSLSFRGDRVDHLPDVRHFTFAVPVDRVRPSELHRLRLEAPGLPAAVVRRPSAAADLRSGDLRARSVDGRVRLTWDGARFPLAVVRDPRTDRIMAFGRSGSTLLRTDAGSLNVTLSAGVGTLQQTVDVR